MRRSQGARKSFLGRWHFSLSEKAAARWFLGQEHCVQREVWAHGPGGWARTRPEGQAGTRHTWTPVLRGGEAALAAGRGGRLEQLCGHSRLATELFLGCPCQPAVFRKARPVQVLTGGWP